LAQGELTSIERHFRKRRSDVALAQFKTMHAPLIGKWSIAVQFVR
jgi:hypothetical protein